MSGPIDSLTIRGFLSIRDMERLKRLQALTPLE